MLMQQIDLNPIMTAPRMNLVGAAVRACPPTLPCPALACLRSFLRGSADELCDEMRVMKFV
jgi:hypothetical protein